jgi:lipoate-protein ligase A
MKSWRWQDSGVADGAAQMSVDAALLQNPSRSAVPFMRVYQWNPSCISLGFHQSEIPIHFDRCRQEGIDVVRRPTGGRAVFHDAEVTYSVVIPRESEWYSKSKHTLYRLISEGLTKGLVRLGLPVEFVKRSADLKSPVNPNASVSCFSSAARWEITLQGRKLVGSAQRLTAAGFLQHGSILTGDGHRRLSFFLKEQKMHSALLSSFLQNKSISIEEYTEQKIPYADVADSLKMAIETVFSIRFIETELTEKEKTLADSIRNRFSVFASGGSG